MDLHLQSTLEQALGEEVARVSPVDGGSIARTHLLESRSGLRFFLKTGFSGSVFSCEANALRELRQSGAIRVPEVLGVGEDFLLLEYIESGREDPLFFERFGAAFAALHRCRGDQFGFYENNYIGLTPQLNLPQGDEAENWTHFYWNRRLLYQYRLAERNGLVSPRLHNGFSKLEARFEKLLMGSEELPALLHGDLWSGNFLFDTQGAPVLIDPAAYYGHREADLAMTRLFGGFPESFYLAYQAAYPLPDGWQRREGLYLLYHVINHLNLFGSSYLRRAELIVDHYLK